MATTLAAAAGVQAEVRKVIREACAEIGWTPRHGAGAVAGEAEQRVFYAAVYQRGWAVPHWPVAYGGQGRPLSDLVIFHEEAARYGAPSQYNRIAIGIAGPALLEFGTREQKERYLPRIADGSEVWCQGFSEPGAGSDLAGLQTKATRSEDGWAVNGQKVWTTLGHVADYCLALVRTGTTGHRGISALIVPMRQPGVTIRPIRQITGDSDFNEVFFDSAVAPSDGLLGDAGGGWLVAMRALEHERSVNFLERQVRLDGLLSDLTRLVQRLEPAADLRTDVVRLLTDAAGLRYAVRDYIERFLGGLPAAPGSTAPRYGGARPTARSRGLGCPRRRPSPSPTRSRRGRQPTTRACRPRSTVAPTRSSATSSPSEAWACRAHAAGREGSERVRRRSRPGRRRL